MPSWSSWAMGRSSTGLPLWRRSIQVCSYPPRKQRLDRGPLPSCPDARWCADWVWIQQTCWFIHPHACAASTAPMARQNQIEDAHSTALCPHTSQDAHGSLDRTPFVLAQPILERRRCRPLSWRDLDENLDKKQRRESLLCPSRRLPAQKSPRTSPTKTHQKVGRQIPSSQGLPQKTQPSASDLASNHREKRPPLHTNSKAQQATKTFDQTNDQEGQATQTNDQAKQTRQIHDQVGKKTSTQAPDQ